MAAVGAASLFARVSPAQAQPQNTPQDGLATVAQTAFGQPRCVIHGTPEPSQLFVGGRSGCVRMTNWDAGALAAMVEEGTTVEFVE